MVHMGILVYLSVGLMHDGAGSSFWGQTHRGRSCEIMMATLKEEWR